MNHEIQRETAIWTKELHEELPLLSKKLHPLSEENGIETIELLTELLRFLKLVSLVRHPITPSYLVDMAWHEFILFTKKYTAFCEEKLGRYIHHTPDDDTKKNSNRFQQTIRYYILYFGEPSADIWGKEANKEWMLSNCGSCSTN